MSTISRGCVVAVLAMSLLSACSRSTDKQSLSNEDYDRLVTEAQKAKTADDEMTKAKQSLAEADQKSQSAEQQIASAEAEDQSAKQREAAIAPTEAKLLEQSQKIAEAQNALNAAQDKLAATEADVGKRESSVTTGETALSKQQATFKDAQAELARQKENYNASLSKVQNLLASKFAPTLLDQVMKGDTIAAFIGFDAKEISQDQANKLRARIVKLNTAKKYAKDFRPTTTENKRMTLVDRTPLYETSSVNVTDSYLVEAKVDDLLQLRSDLRNDPHFSLVVVEPVQRLNISRYLVLKDRHDKVIQRFNLASQVVQNIDFTKVDIGSPSTYAGVQMASICHVIDSACVADLNKSGLLDKKFVVTEPFIGVDTQTTKTARQIILDYTRDAEQKIDGVFAATGDGNGGKIMTIKDSRIYEPTLTDRVSHITDAATKASAVDSAKSKNFLMAMEVGYEVTMFRARAADDYPVETSYNLMSGDHEDGATITQYPNETVFTLPVRKDDLSSTPIPEDFGPYQEFLKSIDQALK